MQSAAKVSREPKVTDAATGTGVGFVLRNPFLKFITLPMSAYEKDSNASVSSVELFDGHPAEEIMNRAKALNLGLIVMGAHEQSTGHTFIGTEVKRVLRRSTVPTLVILHP